VLVVAGAVHDPWACRAALQRWLARRASLDLGARLEGMSATTGLFYRRVRIGNQRTRWASCSRTGTISLNQKLLLLPEHLVDYVFIHELCHTVFLDHSRRFWGLVRAWRPDFRQLERELRHDAPRYVPGWC
jgi:predicted metal-dependent hydrolase